MSKHEETFFVRVVSKTAWHKRKTTNEDNKDNKDNKDNNNDNDTVTATATTTATATEAATTTTTTAATTTTTTTTFTILFGDGGYNPLMVVCLVYSIFAVGLPEDLGFRQLPTVPGLRTLENP